MDLAAYAPADAATLREQAYASLREALTVGKFMPGQKLTIRSIAGALGVSLTPVREALRRLVAEGAFEMRPNRSVRVPVMTRAKVLELRDIRLALEGLAAERAAERITSARLDALRQIALELAAARDRGDIETDRAKIREFHFTLYAAAEMPSLVHIIATIWLQTGPYMNLLFPDYVRTRRGEGRARIIRALQARDGASARREMEIDIGEALTYVAGLADEKGVIAPPWRQTGALGIVPVR